MVQLNAFNEADRRAWIRDGEALLGQANKTLKNQNFCNKYEKKGSPYL